MYDLSDAVSATKGEVSHYIGDEAVLTWKPNRGLPEARCVQCFYLFGEFLKRRRSRYESEYGVFPEFKAGLHFGNVVATEVGDLKSEIVYLGDVLNTTARIQGLCNSFGGELLLSAEIAAHLPAVDWLVLDSLGAVNIKGKAEPVSLYSARLSR
jgi:adenylate cyclase